MKRQSLVLLVVLAAVAVVAAFVSGLALANHKDTARIGPAMMVGSSGDAPDWWGDARGPGADRWRGTMMDDGLCPGWSAYRGMMGPRFDPDR